MATLKQNSEALRAITDKLKSLPKRHVLTEVTLTPSKDDVVAVPNEGEAFSKVTVEGDTNLVAENIAEGVSIFGVTGTHAGGGSTGGGDMDALIEGTLTELTSGATIMAKEALYYNKYLESVSLPNATEIGLSAFQYCAKLVTVNAPNVTKVYDSAFSQCNLLKNVNLPNATTFSSYVFKNCTALENIQLPKLRYIDQYDFADCYRLVSVDATTATAIYHRAFRYCYSLKAVILRSETVCTLSDTNAFENCSHILGTVHSTYNPTGAKDGYIYVPSHLVESYKTATNWSTFASQIRAIDEGGGEADGNWLFQNEQINGMTITGLPAPVIGNSYTCFVDGEEIATARCEEKWDGTPYISFSTEDYRVWLLYDTTVGDTDWYFNPMDSQVQSGSVSIRININGGGTND